MKCPKCGVENRWKRDGWKHCKCGYTFYRGKKPHIVAHWVGKGGSF